MHSNRDLFTCEDNMLFSHVKISCFRAKAHLVFHWYLYNNWYYFIVPDNFVNARSLKKAHPLTISKLKFVQRFPREFSARTYFYLSIAACFMCQLNLSYYLSFSPTEFSLNRGKSNFWKFEC